VERPGDPAFFISSALFLAVLNARTLSVGTRQQRRTVQSCTPFIQLIHKSADYNSDWLNCDRYAPSRAFSSFVLCTQHYELKLIERICVYVSYRSCYRSI